MSSVLVAFELPSRGRAPWSRLVDDEVSQSRATEKVSAGEDGLLGDGSAVWERLWHVRSQASPDYSLARVLFMKAATIDVDLTK